MDLSSIASLAVAAVQLSVVRDVIGAMRAADLAAAAANASPLTPRPTPPAPASTDTRPPSPAIILAPLPLPTTCHPQLCGCHPILTITRQVPNDQTRLALQDKGDTSAPVFGKARPPSIQPPWATLPAASASKGMVVLKLVQYRTDIVNKGMLLDVFI